MDRPNFPSIILELFTMALLIQDVDPKQSHGLIAMATFICLVDMVKAPTTLQVLFPETSLTIFGVMNDMWKFNYNTELWTYLGGSQTGAAAEQYWNYGIQEQPSATNWPYHRHLAPVYTINDTVYMIGGQIDLFNCIINIFLFCVEFFSSWN